MPLISVPTRRIMFVSVVGVLLVGLASVFAQGTGSVDGSRGLKAGDATGRTLFARMGRMTGLPLRAEDGAAAYPATIDPATLRGKVTASDGRPGFDFGWDVSIDGDTAVVGAPQCCIDNSHHGAAYVFFRSQDGSNVWRQIAKLTPSDAGIPGGPRVFGDSVAISVDTVVVGAPSDRGGAYVFSRNHGGPNAWGQVKKLFHPGGPDFRGLGIDVAVDGDLAVVGSLSGIAYVYSRNSGGPNEWDLVGSLSSRDRPGAFTRFGAAVAINDGNIVVGAPDDDNGGEFSGAAYVFAPGLGCCPPGSTWGQVAKLKASDVTAGTHFGHSVSISGTTILVGALYASNYAGAAYFFERDQGGPGVWGQVARIEAGDSEGIPFRSAEGVTPLGFGVSVSIDGDVAAVGAYGAPGFTNQTGAAYVFSRDEGGPDAWGEVVKLAAADRVDSLVGNSFGSSVSLSGNTVIAGNTPGEAAYGCSLHDLDAPDVACRRAPLVFDNLVTLSNVQRSCCANSEFVMTATFTNRSARAIYRPGILVTELSGGNVLKNADGGPAGAGATLTPGAGDDFLSTGESMTVKFVIGLATRDPFRFFVHVTGQHQP